MEQYNEYLTLRGYSSKTRQSMIGTFKRFAKWCEQENTELEQVGYNDVMAYVQYLKAGSKPRTIQIAVGQINHYYNYLMSEHRLPENPASNIEIKGIKRKVLHDILTVEELTAVYRSYHTEREQTKPCPPQATSNLARKRNKIILSLMIYQALRTEELEQLEISDLQLREGKIAIRGNRRTNARNMSLESHQVIDLLDYINTTRKALIELTGKTGQQLFISTGRRSDIKNAIQNLTTELRATNPKIKAIQQLRTSVIVNWLKVYNLRKVQYLCGHRYISSTEAYQMNNMEGLQEEVKQFHPMG